MDEILKESQGNFGLAALKAGVSLEEVAEHLDKNPDLAKNIEDEREVREKAFEEILDLQLKIGILNGEPWAIKAAMRSTDNSTIAGALGNFKEDWTIEIVETKAKV